MRSAATKRCSQICHLNNPGEAGTALVVDDLLGTEHGLEGQKALEDFEAWKKKRLRSSRVTSTKRKSSPRARRKSAVSPSSRLRASAWTPSVVVFQAPAGRRGVLQRPVHQRRGRRRDRLRQLGALLSFENLSNLVPDFPPGVFIGQFMLPLVPAHTKYMTMEMNFSMRTPNGTTVEPLSVERWCSMTAGRWKPVATGKMRGSPTKRSSPRKRHDLPAFVDAPIRFADNRLNGRLHGC